MPFKTPLREAVAEIDFAAPALLEFRANALYNIVRAEFPNYQRFPFFIVPAEVAGGAQAAPYGAAYRFTTEDGKKIVQYGPRMLTYHTWAYPGWETFKAEFSAFFSTVAEAGFGLSTERLALTYVNRLPAETPQQVQQLLRVDLGINSQTVPLDFINRKVEANAQGLSTTIFAPMPPDDIFNSPAFGVTCTELGFVTEEFNAHNVPRYLDWFEAAHARMKDRFWNMLTEEVQESWKESHAAESV